MSCVQLSAALLINNPVEHMLGNNLWTLAVWGSAWLTVLWQECRKRDSTAECRTPPVPQGQPEKRTEREGGEHKATKERKCRLFEVADWNFEGSRHSTSLTNGICLWDYWIRGALEPERHSMKPMLLLTFTQKWSDTLHNCTVLIIY